MLKNVILWRYGRTTWQYDVMCVLILAFIFLTPKHWFDPGELRSAAAHRNQSIVLRFGVPLGGTLDRAEIERRVRAATNGGAARISQTREIKDAAGRVIAYEVDLE